MTNKELLDFWKELNPNSAHDPKTVSEALELSLFSLQSEQIVNKINQRHLESILDILAGGGWDEDKMYELGNYLEENGLR